MLYENLIDDQALLDFSQNFSVERTYLGSTLFPARKVQYLQAEYFRAVANGTLPQIAMVHAFDSEAHIGDRIPLEKVELEELLIKDKINMGERLNKVTNGMDAAADFLRRYAFDDVARQGEKVVTRAVKANYDVMQYGKFTIDENKLNMPIDYGIPAANMVDSTWDASADILADLLTWVDIARDKGAAPNTAITSGKVAMRMRQNAGIQKAISGSANSGLIPTLAQLNAFLLDYVGIEVVVDDAKYGTLSEASGKVSITGNRFLEEKKFILCNRVNGAIGEGLWGVTPEEEAQGNPFDSRREQQYVTVVQWTTKDPVTLWTKASALYVPVLPDVYGHVIADITLAAEDDSEG